MTTSLDEKAEPIVTFGVISDVQYADHDDITHPFSFKKRFYRNAIDVTKAAVEDFKKSRVNYILQLGDLIDGKSKLESEKALTAVLKIFQYSSIPVLHSIGNHELYNFQHSDITQRLSHSKNCLGYYSIVYGDMFRFICLDCYDLSVLGRDPADYHHILSKKTLEINPNSDLNSSTGLDGHDRRFVMYNGGIGDQQLLWLRNEVEEAERNKEKVVVFGHISLSPDVTTPENLLWNYEKVLSILESSSSVVLVLSGHTHQYRSYISDSGTCFVSMPGVIETQPGGKAWATVQLSTSYINMKIYDDSNEHEVKVQF